MTAMKDEDFSLILRELDTLPESDAIGEAFRINTRHLLAEVERLHGALKQMTAERDYINAASSGVLEALRATVTERDALLAVARAVAHITVMYYGRRQEVEVDTNALDAVQEQARALVAAHDAKPG